MALAFLLPFVLGAEGVAGGENLLKHSGMERDTSNWLRPDGWGGVLVHENDGSFAFQGRGYLKLTPTETQEGLQGKIYLWLPQEDRNGQIFRFSLHVRGSGSLQCGVLENFIDAQGRARQREDWRKDAVELSDQWRQAAWTIDLSGKGLTRFSPMVRLAGAGTLYLDEMRMERQVDPSSTMAALTPLQIVPEGGMAPEFRFRAAKAGDPVHLIRMAFGEPARVFRATAGAGGVVVFPGFPAGRCAALPQVVTASCRGAVARSHLHVLSREEFARRRRTARDIRLARPMRALFLGDSLTDFDRGCNYVDRLAFWLNLENPGRFSFRNAGVRGDHIERMNQRFARRGGKRDVYRQQEYDHLFDEPYDLIFVFLGPNDTLAWSTDGFATARIPPERQRREYLRLLDLLERESGAPVALVSAASLDFEACKANAERMLRTGGGRAFRFGEPAKLEAFNAVLRELADSRGLDYVDLYTAMRDSPEKTGLFRTDGVHLNSRGQDFVAGVILNHLRKRTGR